MASNDDVKTPLVTETAAVDCKPKISPPSTLAPPPLGI